MQHFKLSAAVFLYAGILFAISCNQGSKKANENTIEQMATADTKKRNDATATENNASQPTDGSAEAGDTTSQQNTNADSMLAQGMSAMFGKNDSGILKNLGGGKNMDSMMQKMQSMMGGKGSNPGDALSKLILNTQMGQLKDDNPLKSVAKGMQDAQENGTAGPSKTYTAVYTPEQPDNYNVPVSGNGSVIMLQYSGGTSTNNKKDGLWKNVLINTKPSPWNVFTEGYMESTPINMKVHATSLASINENYSITLNEQYKKYSKQFRTESGKYEYDVQVQKMGTEKMFGYSCMHVKITYTVKALGQTSHEQNEEWYSADVPGAQYVSPVIFENHAPAVVKKIIDAGCSGILVKSVTKSTGSSYVLQLSSITKKDMPATQFNIPASYQEDKNTALYDIQ